VKRSRRKCADARLRPPYSAGVVNEFLNAITGLPTAVFSGLLLVTLLYWLLAAIGQVDIDSLNVDVDVDASVDVDADVDIDADVSAPNGMHFSAMGVLEWLSVGKVPLSLIISVWVIYGWMLCMGSELLLRPALGEGLIDWIYVPSVAIAASFAALISTGWTVRPMRKLFSLDDAVHNQDLIGHQVIVTTRAVSTTFGRASSTGSGSDLILNVICDASHTLKRDDPAVVVEYLPERNVYVVAPLPHLQPGFLAETGPSPAAPNDLTSVDAATDHRPRDGEIA
jgi:hypothetical protein